MTQNRFQSALEDLELAIKSSIPHQPIYWKARRLKGEAHLEREEYQKAETELRFFLNRSFQPGDSNYGWRRKAFFNYGRALLQTGKCKEALDAFDQAMLIEVAKDTIPSTEHLFYRNQAQQALDNQPAPKKDARAVKQSA